MNKKLGLLLMLLAMPALAETDAQVQAVQMPAWLQRGDTTRPLRVGLALQNGDRLITGTNARIYVQTADGSTVKLGEKASLTIDELTRGQQEESVFRAALNVAKGAFRFISGQMPEKNMKLQTPTVSIGIRGTELKIDVYEDGSTELSTIEGAANIVSNVTNQALEILAGHSVSCDANGVLGVIRDFIHKSKDAAIERGISEVRSRIPIPIPFDIPNPFR